MRNIRIFFIFLIFIQLHLSSVFSQVSVNTDGNPANSGAMLDISSTDKGFLIPRIDFNDRPNPALAGLLLYVIANGPYGNNEFYFYDGTRWKTFSPIKLGIGDKIMGGTIFWIESDNQHGLIAAPTDVVIGQTGQYLFPWGCYGTFITGLGWDIGTGDENTDSILAHCQEEGIAARVCHDLVLNGYDDWFLPSGWESCQMSFNRDLLGGLDVDGFYWSSSSSSANLANPTSMEYTCSTPPANKNNTYRVRCIRKF
jgi:hypothetical protein